METRPHSEADRAQTPDPDASPETNLEPGSSGEPLPETQFSIAAVSKLTLLDEGRPELGAASYAGAGPVSEETIAELINRLIKGDCDVIAGTVQGDRHEGRVLMFNVAMEPRGWRVHNLGVDLPVREFRAAAQELRPSALALFRPFPEYQETISRAGESHSDADLRGGTEHRELPATGPASWPDPAPGADRENRRAVSIGVQLVVPATRFAGPELMPQKGHGDAPRKGSRRLWGEAQNELSLVSRRERERPSSTRAGEDVHF
jgi:hypothetical protein